MLVEPLQGLLQARLDPGDLVISSRTWSLPLPLPLPRSLTASVSSSFPQSAAKDGCQAPLREESLTPNEEQGGKTQGMGSGRWVGPLLTLLAKTLIGLARVR